MTCGGVSGRGGCRLGEGGLGACFGVAAAGFGAYGAVALDEEGGGAIAFGKLARDGKTDCAGSDDLRAESSRQRSRRHGAA